MQSRLIGKTNYNIYPNVRVGRDCRLDNGVILGFSEAKETKGVIIGNNAILRAFTVVYSDVQIGKNFQSGPHVLIRENNILGDDVVIWHNSTLNPGNIIGDGCRIHANCFLELVTLGKNVFIGPGVVFTDDPHPVNPSPRVCFGGATVNDEAIIGANVTILPHIKIGKRAVIGAGSVVTKNVPENEIWIGNPARFLKRAEDTVCKRKDPKHYPYRDFWKLK